VIEKLRSDAGAELLAPAEALLEAAGLSYESEVAGGQPATLLVELLENYGCEAVVMGAQGAGSGAGSVALALLQHSPVPVTLVRVPEPQSLDDESAGA
jgi:nucleotide-binding universal stress UspA family protein